MFNSAFVSSDTINSLDDAQPHSIIVKYYRGSARVNSDKRHGPKSSDSVQNEIATTRDNLPQPNCNSDGKADNKRQAFIDTDTRRFKFRTGDIGPPGRASLPSNPAKTDNKRAIAIVPVYGLSILSGFN